MFGRRVLEALDADFVENLTIHVRDPGEDDLPRDYERRLAATLVGIRDKGIPFVFRYNIHRVGQDFSALLQRMDDWKPSGLSFAVVVKGKDTRNKYVPIQQLRQYIPDVRRLIDLCLSNRFRVGIAKPLPPCLFGEREGWDLVRRDILSSACCIGEDRFGKNANVNPDLTVSPCFAAATRIGRLGLDLRNWSTMGTNLERYVLPLLREPTFARCSRCYLHHRGICQGVCIASKIEGGT